MAGFCEVHKKLSSETKMGFPYRLLLHEQLNVPEMIFVALIKSVRSLKLFLFS